MAELGQTAPTAPGEKSLEEQIAEAEAAAAVAAAEGMGAAAGTVSLQK
jgi:hypothetical protein